MIRVNEIKFSDLIQKLLALAVFIALTIYILMNASENPKYYLVLDERNILLEGLKSTLGISLITLFLSMILGFILFLLMKSNIVFIRSMAVIFKEIIMGTPLLVMIFIMVYVFGPVFEYNNKLVLGIMAMTLYMTPYLANGYKSAIEIIDEDQYVVMKLYGFNFYERYRYIIFPQMMKPLLPTLMNNLSNTVKGSALLKIVSITEISYVITLISQKSYAAIEGYLVMWMMYLMITIPLSILAQYIGRRLSK